MAEPCAGTVEFELKLELEPAAMAALIKRDWFQNSVSGEPRTRPLHAVYFDTPGRDLRRQGASFRIRREGERLVQCVKRIPRSAEGVLGRHEFEATVSDWTPDLAVLCPDALPLSADRRGDLAPVFTIHTRRTTRELRPHEGIRIEMAQDQVRITAGEAQSEFAEVELELLEGNPCEMIRFARRVVLATAARLSSLFKADRGFVLAGEALPPCVDTPLPDADARAPSPEQLGALVWALTRNVEIAWRNGAVAALQRIAEQADRLAHLLSPAPKDSATLPPNLRHLAEAARRAESAPQSIRPLLASLEITYTLLDLKSRVLRAAQL